MNSGTIVEVLIDTPGLALDKPFDYFVPPEMEQNVAPGQRVFVSFHHQYKAGMIWRVHPHRPIAENIKPILNLVDTEPVLTNELLRLVTWVCKRYVCTMNDAISAMLPGAFRVRGEVHLEARADQIPDDLEHNEIWRMIQEQTPPARALETRFGKKVKTLLSAWEQAGYLRRFVRIREEVKAAASDFLLPNCNRDKLLTEAELRQKRASKQADLLATLAECGEVEWDRKIYNQSTVKALIRDELVRIEARPRSRLQWNGEMMTGEPPELTKWQSQALAHLAPSFGKRVAANYLLHGVTGSGKTEVYIRAIEKVIQSGRQAIVLVPEIALTSQMVGRFYARFGNQIAVLHSGLSMGERRDEWGRLIRGEANIAIGARSAVFAPLQNIGLIVVDEEHEPSYKQEETPYYDAREIARERAVQQQATVIFGSATPSLSSLWLVETGQAKQLTLPVRANNRPLPHVELIDMRDELRLGNKSFFSERLSEEIEHTVAQNQQVILFLNRRGYASAMLCRACGERMRCPRCDISLTVHRTRERAFLSCHYCGFEQPYETRCPECGEEAMRTFGLGTEQVEDAVSRMWPNYRVLRMDVDTTRKKGSLGRIVGAFERGEADILIGTQMIAKGLDFPNVRLVGVMAADTMLAVPDYKANERTFQLLTQVTGRAGRAQTDGLTIIQTYRPEHFAVTTASHHDFSTFYREEQMQRELFRYPPFCELAVFLATHSEERFARGAAMRFERELNRAQLPEDVVVLPASPSGIRRIEDKFRYQVVIKYGRWASVRTSVDEAFRLVKRKMNEYGGTCRIDVNAQRIG